MINLSFGSYKMKLNRELCASRRELSQQSWQDDSLGCWLPIWYCPFITSTSVASLLPFLLPLLLPKLQPFNYLSFTILCTLPKGGEVLDGQFLFLLQVLAHQDNLRDNHQGEAKDNISQSNEYIWDVVISQHNISL